VALGILAIAAKRLGCGDAFGVDIDPQAVISAKDNAERNEVAVDFRLPEEDITHSQHDVVVANILANPLSSSCPSPLPTNCTKWSHCFIRHS